MGNLMTIPQFLGNNSTLIPQFLQCRILAQKAFTTDNQAIR